MAVTNSNLIIIKYFLKLIILLIILIIQKNLFQLRSPSFKSGYILSKKYITISPPFYWNCPPFGTKSFALLVEDPEDRSGIFTLWAVKNIPGNLTKIEEGSIPGEEVANSWGIKHYKGLKIKKGCKKVYFKLYALNENYIYSDNLKLLRGELEIRNIGMAYITGYFEGEDL